MRSRSAYWRADDRYRQPSENVRRSVPCRRQPRLPTDPELHRTSDFAGRSHYLRDRSYSRFARKRTAVNDWLAGLKSCFLAEKMTSLYRSDELNVPVRSRIALILSRTDDSVRSTDDANGAITMSVPETRVPPSRQFRLAMQLTRRRKFCCCCVCLKPDEARRARRVFRLVRQLKRRRQSAPPRPK